MKRQYFLLSLTLLLSGESLFAQTNQTDSSYIPFLDKESQSNVIVTVSDFYGDGQPCPLKYTNVLSNTNLFTPEEQGLIKEAFVKYQHITTNSGPPGTELVNLYRTNFLIKAMDDRTVEVENWVARYQYTNSNAQEEVTIGRSLSAKFRTKANDGYNVYIVRIGGGALLRFLKVKQDKVNGFMAEFNDAHEQGTTWDYKRATFSDSHLTEYMQITKGLTLGKFFMWNPKNGNLCIEAEFKEPYDFVKHRTDLHVKVSK